MALIVISLVLILPPHNFNHQADSNLTIDLSSDTSYMAKVIEMKEHAELCILLATEGYGVMVLPVVLGSAGTRFTCLDPAQKNDIPNARKSIQQATPTHSTKPCVSMTIPGKAKANILSKGKDKKQIASLPTPICP
jgi:hypothetical protein